MKSLLSSSRTAGHRAMEHTWWRMMPVLLFLVSGSAGGFAGSSARAESGVSKEHEVKAGFLFNFLQFVDWPAASFPSTDTPLVIGVLGENPFGSVLDRIVAGQTVKGRGIVVKRSGSIDELKGCHMLFVSASEKDRTGQILAALAGSPALTVGEIQGFAARGGGINFFLQGGKGRFEINPEAAKRGGIRISSQLLSLGRIVGREE